jgi:hypothetical protein
MAESKVCTVDQVGPASNGTETAVPVIYIMLTDDGNAFNNQWFYAAQDGKNEMLAVALMARSLGRQVSASIDLPNPAGVPYTAIYRLYLN